MCENNEFTFEFIKLYFRRNQPFGLDYTINRHASPITKSKIKAICAFTMISDGQMSGKLVKRPLEKDRIAFL